MESGYVDVSGFKLKYLIEGEGEPILVVGSTIYYPRTFSKNLKKKFKLIYIDHRGFAECHHSYDVSQLTLDTILDDIEALRIHLKLDHFYILGHSGHGYMALEYAKKHPKHVKGVIMIATGPSHAPCYHQEAKSYLDSTVCHARKEALAKSIEDLEEAISKDPDNRFITFCLKLGPISWYDYNFDASYLWKDVKVNMPIIDRLWGEVFRDIDITTNLKELKKPVLLCLGLCDYLVAPFYSWYPLKDHFYDLTLKIFEKSSHTPQLEECGNFDEVITQLVK